MLVCCPVCSTDFPIEAGFAEADGKRLAAVLAELEPAVGRALIGYLRLFKPAKTALRMARAAKMVDVGQWTLEQAEAYVAEIRGGQREPG